MAPIQQIMKCENTKFENCTSEGKLVLKCVLFAVVNQSVK